ncbi:hypothetical protein [Vulgatibacter sp.]|uniref:hypothetical protein n=1 Tax=Vulgatibacter sp. TaxID=1971226 RepID=UPI00356526F5
MKRTIVAIAALGLVASACSSGKESQREDETAAQAEVEPVAPKMGVLTSVDAQRLMLDSAEDPGDDEELFERTTRSVVMRDGSEIAWEELSEGDAVRVTWDRGIFGPDRVAQVEVLSGEDADQVRQQVESGSIGMEEENGIGGPMEPREIEPESPSSEPGMGPGDSAQPAEPMY